MQVYTAMDEERVSFDMTLLNVWIDAKRREIDEQKELTAQRFRLKPLREMADDSAPMHVKARTQGNPDYPERAHVPDHLVRWSRHGDETPSRCF